MRRRARFALDRPAPFPLGCRYRRTTGEGPAGVPGTERREGFPYEDAADDFRNCALEAALRDVVHRPRDGNCARAVLESIGEGIDVHGIDETLMTKAILQVAELLREQAAPVRTDD